MHLSRLGLLVHLVASLSGRWWQCTSALLWLGSIFGVLRCIAGAAHQGHNPSGWACTSARTSPRPSSCLIGWLGGPWSCPGLVVGCAHLWVPAIGASFAWPLPLFIQGVCTDWQDLRPSSVDGPCE